MNMVDDDVAKILSTLSPLPLWLDRDALIQGGYLFDIHQVVHFDEVHIKQKYGGLGAFQMRFKRESGEVVKNECDTYKSIINNRGSYGPEQFQTTLKFEEEARMMMGVSMVRVKNNDGDYANTKGVRCPVFDYTGKIIVGMGKWKRLVRQAIDDAKKSCTTYWVSKKKRPVGKEIFDGDDLLSVPRIGKKTASLLNSVGLFKVLDLKDDGVGNRLSALDISDRRQKQLLNIIQSAVSNSNPGKSLLLLLFINMFISYTHFSNMYI